MWKFIRAIRGSLERRLEAAFAGYGSFKEPLQRDMTSERFCREEVAGDQSGGRGLPWGRLKTTRRKTGEESDYGI